MLGVVSELCGLHAQVMSSTELSLWARVEGLRSGAVKKALWTDRSLVRMWAMRGTLHLLPASEHALWQAALSTSPTTEGRAGLGTSGSPRSRWTG